MASLTANVQTADLEVEVRHILYPLAFTPGGTFTGYELNVLGDGQGYNDYDWVNITRTWYADPVNGSHIIRYDLNGSNVNGQLFPRSVRSIAEIVVVDDFEDLALYADFVGTRRWNGIGGQQFIPTFPQLDLSQQLNWTTFPTAH
jgi:hypothetical protein